MKNFEKFKTADERAKAFKEWCHKQDVECNKCRLFSSGEMSRCRFAWLDLEAEKEKPLPCPFCGAGAYVNEGENGYGERLYSVNCSCGYRTKENYRSHESAVTAHNLVARAVMEAEKEGAEE